MSEQTHRVTIGAKDKASVRMRIDDLLNNTDQLGLTDALHHHCKSVFSVDLYSVDSSQLAQLETTFGYFFTVLTAQSKQSELIH